jgi:hypothetical protein
MTETAPTRSDSVQLVPTGTEVEESGQGGAVALEKFEGKPILLTVEIQEVIEQESLHLSVWGSADGADWGSQALFWFPQKFYAGATPAVVDLAQRPDLKYLQVRWEVNRWGRGTPRPHFKFSVAMQEFAV